jgi:ribosomal protein L7/L12
MMTADVAQEIASRHRSGDRIGAIRQLRDHAPFGLQDAKRYLESAQSVGDLYRKLCKDYVQSPEDLLRVAEIERKRLDDYIEDLKSQIEDPVDQFGLGETELIRNVFDEQET